MKKNNQNVRQNYLTVDRQHNDATSCDAEASHNLRTVQHGVDTCHHIDIETAVLVVWSRILENGLLVVVALLSAFCLFRREIDIINKKKRT